MSTRAERRYLWWSVAAIAVMLVATWLAPIDIQQESSRRGRLLAASTWSLERSGQGTLVARYDDRIGAVSRDWTVRTVERGDAATFRMSPGLSAGSRVASGDTVGVLHSALTEQRLAELSARSGLADSERRALNFGAKASEVQEAEVRLIQLESLAAVQARIVDRLEQLQASGGAAADEVDRSATELYRIRGDIEIARARLDVLNSGARPADRAVADARRQVIADEEAALDRLTVSRAVVAPISGMVVRPARDSVLVRVVDLGHWMVVFSIPTIDRSLVAAGSEVVFEDGTGVSGVATVDHVDPVAHSLGGERVVLVTARVDSPDRAFLEQAIDGLDVQIHIARPSRRLRSWLLGFVGQLFRGPLWRGDAQRS